MTERPGRPKLIEIAVLIGPTVVRRLLELAGCVWIVVAAWRINPELGMFALGVACLNFAFGSR